MSEIKETLELTGFDADGEPEIRIMDDGSFYVVFEAMPPFWTDEDEDLAADFEDFDKQLEAAIGVPVIWEDRELFCIQHPKEDTVARIRQFVEGYREQMGLEEEE